MPITRRRRANPPDQPENNNHVGDQLEQHPDALAPEKTAETTTEETASQDMAPPPVTPVFPSRSEGAPFSSFISPPPQAQPQAPTPNGERLERSERQEYAPTIESGRRTARGELFRRPPQPPTSAPTPIVTTTPLQPPSHEMSLPLGNLLHLAYNPGYTGAAESRSILLQQLAAESKAGGRARCWNCGSLAIAYDCWNTQSKTFGEVGVAFCEICGVWSVM